ncbi:Paired mesoderm homeobox protein 2 [Dictyocoela muelleri]|nr:Paired mesoderm homeobox protein 2 [Dictyocoela muelleri]
MAHVNKSQFKILKNIFEKDNLPDSYVLNKISVEINLPYKTLQIWFQNMRAKLKRENNCKNILSFTDKSKILSFTDKSKILSGKKSNINGGISLLNTRYYVKTTDISKLKFSDYTNEIENVNFKNENCVKTTLKYWKCDENPNLY